MNATRTVGDHGTVETFRLDGATVNLSGATGEAHIKRPDGTVITLPAQLVGNAASFTWAPGNLSIAGEYEVEIEVAYSNGARQTFQVNPRGSGVRLTVRKQLA